MKFLLKENIFVLKKDILEQRSLISEINSLEELKDFRRQREDSVG